MNLEFKTGNPKEYDKKLFAVRYHDGTIGTEEWNGSDWGITSKVITAWAEFSVKPELNVIGQFPHCDPKILHAPNECHFCDMHPDWQQLRQVWKINFTGEYDPNKELCPAEKARPLSSINRWGGNTPKFTIDFKE